MDIMAAGAAADIRMYAGGTGIEHEALRVTRQRLIGVGTQSPTATLQVSGTFTVSMTGQDSTPSLHVASNGRVGVGLSAPSHKLHVAGNDVDGLSVSGVGGTGGTHSLTMFGSSVHSLIGAEAARIVAPSNRSLAVEIRGNDGNDRFSVMTASANNATIDTESFVVKNNGIVGVGMANPLSTFGVAGTISATDAIQVGSSSL
ncbi:MAG: hypothetical protein CTY21_14370, partial [Methylomonas sp.]